MCANQIGSFLQGLGEHSQKHTKTPPIVCVNKKIEHLILASNPKHRQGFRYVFVSKKLIKIAVFGCLRTSQRPPKNPGVSVGFFQNLDMRNFPQISIIKDGCLGYQADFCFHLETTRFSNLWSFDRGKTGFGS